MSWIFQAIPRRYDLRTRMIEGKAETWLVTRFRDEMKRGDLVFMWLAGAPEIRGIYGWAEIVWEEPRYFDGWGHGVGIEFRKVFPEHISSETIRALPAFADHVIFKTAIGTNFKLNALQGKALADLIGSTFGAGFVPPDGATDHG